MAELGLFRYRARPVRVIDGDTLVAMLDLGFGCRFEATLRLHGFDAPEAFTPLGKEATGALSRLLWPSGDDPWPLRVETRHTLAGTEARSFSRWVADVWCVAPDGRGVSVAEWMAERGHAKEAS